MFDSFSFLLILTINIHYCEFSLSINFGVVVVVVTSWQWFIHFARAWAYQSFVNSTLCHGIQETFIQTLLTYHVVLEITYLLLKLRVLRSKRSKIKSFLWRKAWLRCHLFKWAPEQTHARRLPGQTNLKCCHLEEVGPNADVIYV